MNEPIVTLATPEKLTVQTSVDQCSGDDKTVLTKESSQQNRSFHTSTSTAARAWTRGANLIDEGTVQAEGRRADVGMSHVESLSCAWPG